MTVDKTEAMLGSYGPQQEEYTKIVSHQVGFGPSLTSSVRSSPIGSPDALDHARP
jgi:hypothetical protein